MNSVLPEAIRNQLAEAVTLQKELYGQAPENVETAEANSVTAEVPEPQVETPASESQLVTEPVTQPSETPKSEPESDEWRHKYNTLKGKFDAEVPRLYQALKERDAQLQSLLSRLEQLEKQPEQTTEEPLVTKKDEEEFGADLVSMVRRAAKEEVRVAVAAVMKEFDSKFSAFLQQVNAVQTKVQMSEAERFWNRVRSLVPDWDNVDTDPDWIDFLDTSPDYTTETYRELATKAIQASQAEKVAKLVEIWRGNKNPAPSVTVPNPELQRQVAPSTVKSSTPVQPAKKIYTREEYEALYDVRNEQRYGAKRAAEMRAEADLAVAEGRVRW